MAPLLGEYLHLKREKFTADNYITEAAILISFDKIWNSVGFKDNWNKPAQWYVLKIEIPECSYCGEMSSRDTAREKES